MDIAVVGSQDYSVPPERATVHLEVGFEGAEMSPLLAKTGALVSELNRRLEHLRSDAVGAVTWHAIGPLGTRSWRPYNNQGHVLPLRHAASVSARAKFRDFSALATFTADWGAREGVHIGHVDWALTEARRAELESRVLAQAVAEARRRALVLARAAGASDVEPVEIADPGLLSGLATHPGASVPLSGHAMRAAGGSMESAAPVVPEDVRGAATVHARFRATGSGQADLGS